MSQSRKDAIRAHADSVADARDSWIARNAYYHREDRRFLRYLIPEGARVLDVGCATGDLLAELKPARGIGLDLSERMIALARQRHPDLTFVVGDVEDPAVVEALDGPFDYIVLSDTIGALTDVQRTLGLLGRLCTRKTRIVIAYHSGLWAPLLDLADRVGLRMPQPHQNRLTTDDMVGMLALEDYELVQRDWRQLVPRRLLGLGTLVNRFIGSLPGLRRLCLRNYIVARPVGLGDTEHRSCSVIVPCRNEKGNIEPAVTRLPAFCEDIEIIFVEGRSQDGTWDEVLRVQAAYPDRKIVALQQDGIGKADAVFKGFDAATGDVLMILDADLTVPPEDLPKFWAAIKRNKGEFINGTRLVYPMEDEAMRLLNFMANTTFSWLFTWLLNQRFTDTLCGTKVIARADYALVERARDYFQANDPFGDFDLLFGAAKGNLKIVELPIRYASRTYGETQISRFRHGFMLLKMVRIAYLRMKAQ